MAKSLEILLKRATELLADMSAQDPRSRLLQTALLRRDHALLRAVVQSVEQVRHESALRRLWSARQLKVRPVFSVRISERPTCRPPRRVAAE